MEITNEKRFRNIELVRRLLGLLSVAAIASMALWHDVMPMYCMFLAGFVIGLTLAILIYQAIVGVAYFSYTKVGDVNIFRYCSVGNLSYKREKISISQADFKGFEIRSSCKNLRHTLILKEQIKGRTATYPPIIISTLKEEQRKQLAEQLKTT